MVSVLWKIPFRKIRLEKGRSICVILAVFCTTVLFTTVFSTLFFAVDAAEEMMRETSPILADAALVVTQEEHERICHNKRVAETGMGIRFAIVREPSGAGGIQMFTFDDRMAEWMRYYPTKGRMPVNAHEIVVSDQYLRECGLAFDPTGAGGNVVSDSEKTGGNAASNPEETGVRKSAGSAEIETELTYYIEDEEYTDIFTIVGTYEMSGQPLHVVLTSDDFYREVCERFGERGDDPEEKIYRMTGVMFKSRSNVRRLVSRLAAEEEIDVQEGEIYLSNVSILESMGIGVWAALFIMLFFVMMIGYLFISNIFQISALKEVRFYGKLSANGVTKREIIRIVRRENNILLLISVIPAMAAGYAFSSMILPGILSANLVLQAKRSGNVMIFILSLVFSYLTVIVSEKKAVKLVKNASPTEMRTYAGKLKRVKTADHKDCTKKLRIRHLQSDKIKALKVCVSVACSLMLACAFHAVAEGFDEEAYVQGELAADYIIAKKPVFVNPNLNHISYARTSEEEITDVRELSGIREEGGAAMSYVKIALTDEGMERLSRIGGAYYGDSVDSFGEAWIDIYGLDEMLLRKLEPIRGEIDWEQFNTGNYVLLNPIYSDDNTDNEACYEPGDEVTVHFRSGEEGTYTVMAIVERLPVSLAFPSLTLEGDMYLPMRTWQEMEKRTDYYLYAFDVEEECHETWDHALGNRIGEAENDLLAYRSAQSEVREAQRYTDGLKLAGFVLSMILLSMGILNFINCTVSGIYSRRREFAVMRSMGVEELEIGRSLAEEGMLYMAGGFVPGMVLAVPGVYILIDKVLAQPYITYHVYPFVYILFAVLLCAVAILVPRGAYRMMERKQNFLGRLRN